jgi:16S rRNA (cytidine1402-2'-O)-methyltransferase
VTERKVPGALVLVATPIGNLGDLAPRAVEALATADVIACEDTRHSRKLLTHAGIGGVPLLSLHRNNEQARVAEVLERVRRGERVAVVTDAGTPVISDPGARVVRAAIDAGLAVEIVPGPSAVTAALAVSGLSADRFCFEGFLPRKGKDRADRLAAVAAETRTTVLFEAPHRVRATVADLLATAGSGSGERAIAIARELTKRFEEVWRGSLDDAVAHIEGTDPRGEYVLVLEGASVRPASDADVEAALHARLAAGEPKKSAIAAVAVELDVPKRTVYQISLRC